MRVLGREPRIVAEPQTAGEVRAYLQAVALSEVDRPCKYGHSGCALWRGGPCFDELAGLIDLDLVD